MNDDVKVEAIMRRMRDGCNAGNVGYILSDSDLRSLTSAALKGIEDVDGKPLASAEHSNDTMYDRVGDMLYAGYGGCLLTGTLAREIARAAVDEMYAAQDELEINSESLERTEIALPATFDVPPKGEMVLVIHRLDGTILVQRNRYL